MEKETNVTMIPISIIDGGGVTMDVTIDTNDGLVDVDDMEETNVPFKNIRIDDNLWDFRLQDVGCCKEYVVKITYRMNSVMSFGPKDDLLYYEQLSASVIDLVKAINEEKKKEGDGSVFQGMLLTSKRVYSR